MNEDIENEIKELKLLIIEIREKLIVESMSDNAKQLRREYWEAETRLSQLRKILNKD